MQRTPTHPLGEGGASPTKHTLKGVTVHYICTTLREEVCSNHPKGEAKVYDIEPTVIRPKGANVICPRDGKLGAAYVDCLSGAESCGIAEYMLSYTWGYLVNDIADTLSNFCSRKGVALEAVSIWICCLCINQHRVKEQQAIGTAVPFEEFELQFGERVVGIGRVIAMMSPWRSPHYLSRVWCNYEMFRAISEDLEVEIAMPSRESRDFISALHEGDAIQDTFDALGKIAIERASASIPADKERILSLIEEGPGYHHLNAAVRRRMQLWVVHNLCERFKEIFANQDAVTAMSAFLTMEALLAAVPHVMASLEPVFEDIRKSLEQVGDLSTSPLGVIVLAALGLVSIMKADLHRARDLFRVVESAYANLDMHEPSFEAYFQTMIGFCDLSSSAVEKAWIRFECAKQILSRNCKSGRTEIELWLNACRLLGNSKARLGDMTGALAEYSSALDVQCQEVLRRPHCALLLRNMGDVQIQCGDMAGASLSYEKALAIRERTHTLESSDGANLLASMGLWSIAVGAEQDALDKLESAVSIRSRINTLCNTSGEELLTKVQDLKSSIARQQPTAEALPLLHDATCLAQTQLQHETAESCESQTMMDKYMSMLPPVFKWLGTCCGRSTG